LLFSLSAGQKQLVVLARAMLKQNKVLILDEATASMDSATDAEIGRVIQNHFQKGDDAHHRASSARESRQIDVMDSTDRDRRVLDGDVV